MARVLRVSKKARCVLRHLQHFAYLIRSRRTSLPVSSHTSSSEGSNVAQPTPELKYVCAHLAAEVRHWHRLLGHSSTAALCLSPSFLLCFPRSTHTRIVNHDGRLAASLVSFPRHGRARVIPSNPLSPSLSQHRFKRQNDERFRLATTGKDVRSSQGQTQCAQCRRCWSSNAMCSNYCLTYAYRESNACASMVIRTNNT